MNVRFVLAAAVVACASFAACSGNFGSGTGAPSGVIPSGPLGGVVASPTPTPNAASGIATYGDSAALQPLPAAAGYGGAIAFAIPSPKPSGFTAVPIGVTLAVVAPTDAPDLNVLVAGKKAKKRERPARPLAYLTLIATRDINLDAFPRIAFDVPRDVVTTYREDELFLALFNAGDKDKTYRLAVAERDVVSPAPSASATVTATNSPTPKASPSPAPSSSAFAGAVGFPTGPLNGPGNGGGPPGAPGAAPSPTLPPQRIVFAPTAASLKLTANRTVVFALYALPRATPSPAPSSSAKGKLSTAIGSPSPAASASSTATPSTSPGASASASPSGSAPPSIAPSP